MPTSYSEPQKKFSLLRLLSDNHKQSSSILQRLERMIANIADPHSCTDTLTNDLHLIADFFNSRINENHVDEEVYIYQFILNGADKKLASVGHRLLAEHVWIEDCWASLHTRLRSAIQNPTKQHTQALEYATALFIQFQREHMEQEEAVIFPAAKQLINQDAAARIAHMLQQRRANYPVAETLAA